MILTYIIWRQYDNKNIKEANKSNDNDGTLTKIK